MDVMCDKMQNWIEICVQGMWGFCFARCCILGIHNERTVSKTW